MRIRKTTAAVLRATCGINKEEMADVLGCSVDTIRSVECGRGRLTEDLARRMSHETGVSLAWLLAGDPKTPPTLASGEKYTEEIYKKMRAGKKWVDQPHLFVRTLDGLQFCAQLLAVLEKANTDKNYALAAFKTGRALDTLKNEFGQDEEYPWSADSRWGNPGAAINILKRLIDNAKDFFRKEKRFRIAQQKKRSSSSQRRARA